jgi:hypothetical protein
MHVKIFTQFLLMEDLTFDNDEEKCEGEAQQPHARAPTSHLRGCCRVGLRSSSRPSSDLGSVIVLQSSASTTISLFYRPLGFVWVGLYPYTVLDTRGQHFSCGLTSVLLIWPLTFFAHPASGLLLFLQSTTASIHKALRNRCGL